MSDTFKRLKVSKDAMQCGCKWIRNEHGDVLVQCQIHQQASNAMVKKFERERGQKGKS
jgi:hypothetical protein